MPMTPNIVPEPAIREETGPRPPEAMQVNRIQPIGPQQLHKFTQILEAYKTGLQRTKARIIASETWWKMRNEEEEQKETMIGKDGGFTSKSGWLHNVIVNKHADAMAAYPEPIALPREKGDKSEAEKLSAILPCVLKQNKFEQTYSDAMWQKDKTGTGVYKVVWDKNKLNGLGDISIEKANLLNLFWEPGITNIQKSRYFFHTEMADVDLLEQMYPELKDQIKGRDFVTAEFIRDEKKDTENKATVIEVYYHKYIGPRKVLHYCKYVGEHVLFASENEVESHGVALNGTPIPPMAEAGLYDHGLYPYVFDPLFPVEDSPCGYGYVDICRNPQIVVDILDTSVMKNSVAGATPRYMVRDDAGINEEELLDLSKPVVHAKNLDDRSVRPMETSPLAGVYVNVRESKVQELRETSGNTETATGSTSSGVTAASAIAALQEASGKGSRDATQASYRAYVELVEMCIELIRQFYDLPRQFRITGKYGENQYTSYSNNGLKAVPLTDIAGNELGMRLPVFDIEVKAQKQNAYTKLAQNELALQFFKMGFFNPQMVDQAVMCIEMMDFDGKEEILGKIMRNGTMYQKLIQYMQLALTFAAAVRPDMVQGLSQDIAAFLGNGQAAGVPGGNMNAPRMSGGIPGADAQEPTHMQNARERANSASQPSSGQIVKGEDGR